MPGSVTADLITISLAEATTGWSGNSGGLDQEVYKQATGSGGSYTWAVRKNTFDSVTFTPASNIDMTANYSIPHLYWTMRCDVFPFCEDLNTSSTNSGLMVRVTDGSGNWTQWHVAGADTWDGGWRTFVLDLTNTANTHSSSGTLDLSDVDVITWYVDNSNSGNIRIIDNTWMDAVRYGDGLQAESATTEAFDFEDIAHDDGLVANYYGGVQLVDGVIFVQGGIDVGDATGSATANLVSNNEQIVFRDQIVDAAHYKIRGLASATATTDVDINGLIVKTVGGSGNEWDFSDADLNSYAVKNSVFIDLGTIALRVGTTTAQSFSGCGATTISGTHAVVASNWTLCDQITLEDTATLALCKIVDSTAASAVACSDLGKISNTEFESDGTGHAIVIDTPGTYSFTGNTFTGYASSDGSTGNECIYNNSGGLVTINVSGGDTPTIRNGTSATTTVNATVGFSLTNVVSGTKLYVEAEAGGSLTDGDEMIAPVTVTVDPYTTNLTANQPFKATLAHASGATKYKPIIFNDTTGAGFSRRIEQTEDA